MILPWVPTEFGYVFIQLEVDIFGLSHIKYYRKNSWGAGGSQPRPGIPRSENGLCPPTPCRLTWSHDPTLVVIGQEDTTCHDHIKAERPA